MHSERILLFEPEASKLRKAGVGGYGNILVRTLLGAGSTTVPHCLGGCTHACTQPRAS